MSTWFDRFGPVITAMATPFDGEGRLDLPTAESLAVKLVESGSSALVLTGTTGEVPTLSDYEKEEVWSAVASAVSVPVIAGAGTNDTRHSIELVRRAEAAGAAAVLTVVPYYNRPPQEGLFFHFQAIAKASALPVILYDIPFRTGRALSSSTLFRLVEAEEGIVGLKDATSNASETSYRIANLPEGFAVYSGDDSMTLPLLSVGAKGVISVASHWAAPAFLEMIRAYNNGEVDRAASINKALIPSYRFQSQEDAPNPMPLKAILEVLGLSHCYARPPLQSPNGELKAAAKVLLAELRNSLVELGVSHKGDD